MTGPTGEPLTEAESFQVRGASVFAPLSPEALTGLLSQAVAVTVPALEAVFDQEQKADYLVVVAKGTVGLMAAVGPDGSCLVELVAPGQVIGEAGLFDTGRYPVAARAVTEARVIMIPAAAVLACLAAHPGLRRQMLGFMSARLRVLVRQLAQLRLLSAAQRLGGFLLGMTDRQPGSQTIRLACERRLIAGMLGMTPESLSRSLRQLRELGVRNQGKRDIVIEDVDRLRAFVAADGT